MVNKMNIQPGIGRLQSPLKACQGVSFSRTVKSLLLQGEITFRDVNIPSGRVSYFKSSMPAHLKCILHSRVLPGALRKITARWVVGAACPEMPANCQEARKVEVLLGAGLKMQTSVRVCKLECMFSVMLAMCIISHFVRQLSPMSFSAEGGTPLILKLTRDQTRVKGRETVLLCTQAGYADILKEKKKKKRKIYGITLASSLFPCF